MPRLRMSPQFLQNNENRLKLFRHFRECVLINDTKKKIFKKINGNFYFFAKMSQKL